MIRPVKLPPGLEPASMNSRTVAAEVPTLLVIELDGGASISTMPATCLPSPRTPRSGIVWWTR